MTLAKHRETIESHVGSNVAFAIDQADDYGGLQGAFESFAQNTFDSCMADGYDSESALDAKNWFCDKFNKAAGTDF
jgi:hypothetical protein